MITFSEQNNFALLDLLSIYLLLHTSCCRNHLCSTSGYPGEYHASQEGIETDSAVSLSGLRREHFSVTECKLLLRAQLPQEELDSINPH